MNILSSLVYNIFLKNNNENRKKITDFLITFYIFHKNSN